MLIRLLTGFTLAFSCLFHLTHAETAAPSNANATESETAASSPVTAQVLHCHDGDTCRVKVGGQMWINIRFAGIDAPEVQGRNIKKGQKIGDEARDYVNSRLKGKTVQLVQTDLDHYNRPVCEIYLDKTLINIEILEKGLAEAYRGPAKRLDRDPYFKAEQKAKDAKTGIWALATYQSPADFRKKDRAAAK
jgi:endonuclease YncB( thermonuclease family)